MKRIYINEFIRKFFFPLFGKDTTTKIKNKFALELLDLDSDGNLSTKDLVALDDVIEPMSKAGRELQAIKNYYVNIL